MKHKAIIKTIKILSCLIAGIFNGCFILLFCYFGLLNEALNIFVGGIISYPIANIIKKYLILYLLKVYRRLKW